MVRSFTEQPIEERTLDLVLDAARRAPSAGNAQGTDLLVLTAPDARARFWDLTLPAGRREAFAWPGLLRAPVLVLPLADEATYRARYAEADKASSGLAALDAGDPWPVPYWLTDTAFGVMLLLLAAEGEGLGALFFALGGDEGLVLEAFGVPARLKPIGVVALGHPDGEDRPGRSATRPRRSPEQTVHHDHW